MRVVPLSCDHCGVELGPEVDTVAFCCRTCSRTWSVGDEGLQAQAVRWAHPLAGQPWWWMPGTVSVQTRQTFGRDVGEDPRWQQLRGIWVPAFERDVKKVQQLAQQLSFNPPSPAVTQPQPKAYHEPCVLTASDARELVDVIVLHVETKRADKLRDLGFTVELGEPELWILGG